MKKKLKFILKILILIISVFGLTYFIASNRNETSSTLVDSDAMVSETQSHKIESNYKEIVAVGKFGISHSQGGGAINSSTSPSRNRFIFVETGGRLIYCIERGGPVRTRWPSPADIQKQANAINSSNPSQHASCPSGYFNRSFSHWVCGSHTNAKPDLAYVVSEPTTYRNSKGEEFDVDKYVLKRASQGNGANCVNPSQDVVNQSKKYQEIFALYKKFKDNWKSSDERANDEEYYEAYVGYCNSFTTSDWYTWIHQCWPYERYYRNSWRPSPYYHEVAFAGIIVPSSYAQQCRADYSTWRKYMIKNSSGYANWKNWIDSYVNNITYEQYYDYYRYVQEHGDGIIGADGQAVNTKDNRTSFMKAMAYARYGMGISNSSTYYDDNYVYGNMDEQYKKWVDNATRNGMISDDEYYNSYEPYCDSFSKDEWDEWINSVTLNELTDEEADDPHLVEQYNQKLEDLKEQVFDYEYWRKCRILESEEYGEHKKKLDEFFKTLASGDAKAKEIYSLYYGYAIGFGYKDSDFIDGMVPTCDFYKVMGAVVKLSTLQTDSEENTIFVCDINTLKDSAELKNEWDKIQEQDDVMHKNEIVSLYPKDYNSEEDEETRVETAPRNDVADGVVDYYLNEHGFFDEAGEYIENGDEDDDVDSEDRAIVVKYKYGMNVGGDIKQYAVWLRNGNAKGDGIAHNRKSPLGSIPGALLPMARALLAEGEEYAKFGEKMDANEKKDPNNILNLVNHTDSNKVKIAASKAKDGSRYKIVGPFNMTYLEGKSSKGVNFGGISGMWVVGYDIKGKVVKSKIPIESFIIDDDPTDELLDGLEFKARYFTPNTTTGSYTDTGAQKYPGSGEWFYIKFKDPNASSKSTKKEQYVETIDVKVEFEWMRAQATVCYLKGGQDEIVRSDHTHVLHCHGHVDEEGNETTCSGCCYDCHYRVKVVPMNFHSQDLIDVWGQRTLYRQVISLTGKTNDGRDWEPPSGTTEMPVQKIWDGLSDSDAKKYRTTFTLYKNGKATNQQLTVSGNGLVKFTGLDTSSTYRVAETKIEEDTNGDGVYDRVIADGEDQTYVFIDKQQQIDGVYKITNSPPGDSILGHDPQLVFRKGPINITMRLGGYVWEDEKLTKENKADGLRVVEKNDGNGEKSDIPLKNVKVTLYDYNGGKPFKAELITDEEEAVDTAELMHRINPTLTDENGYYQFNGLDDSRKYFVVFEYNGQKYLPTEYLNVGESANNIYGEGEQAVENHFNSVNDMVHTAKLYNTTEWYLPSKALEADGDRTNLDNRFKEIGSYPENYKTGDVKVSSEIGEYNSSYSQLDLLGYTLNKDGKYEKTGKQLVDGYKYNELGLEITQEEGGVSTYSDGEISKAIRKFIKNNRRYPTDSEMSNIYAEIAEGDKETLKKLQFILDCQIQAYTASKKSIVNALNDKNLNLDLYPVYDNVLETKIFSPSYTLEQLRAEYPNSDFVRVYDGWVERDRMVIVNIDDGSETEYRGVYDGQFYVNLGLWRRQESDVTLRKDVYRAVVKINDKTEIYKYDKRAQQTNESDGTGINSGSGNDNNTLWDINVRVSDATYYKKSTNDTMYNRELYQSDYEYKQDIAQNHKGDRLNVYVTYKLTIRNQSLSVLNEIEEVVDYYDKEYEYQDHLSWIIYQDSNKVGERLSETLDEGTYHDLMAQEQKVLDGTDGAQKTSAIDKIKTAKKKVGEEEKSLEAKPVKSSDKTKYWEGVAGSNTTSDIPSSGKYKAVYIRGLDGKKLASGENAYIYLTFKVKHDGANEEGKLLVDDATNPKQNIAEINGYTTWYKSETVTDENGTESNIGTELPNGVTKTSNDIAGLFDRDSNPGNLVAKDIEGEEYQNNFEDDTDEAVGLNIHPINEDERIVKGVVWEDERNNIVNNAIVGDGKRVDGEKTVKGVTVQLIEKYTTDDMTVAGEVNNTTNKENIIEYVWAETETDDNGEYEFKGFIPGNYVVRFYYGDTDATVKIKDKGGANIVSYNGQDFKSTTYHAGVEESDKATNVTTGSFKYNLEELDASNENFSDAKDLWTNTVDYVGTPEEIKPGIMDHKINIKALHGRDQVINYSKENVTNHKAEVLASPYDTPTYNGVEASVENLQNELRDNTYMTAETGVVTAEVEYNRKMSEGSKQESNSGTPQLDTSGTQSSGESGDVGFVQQDEQWQQQGAPTNSEQGTEDESQEPEVGTYNNGNDKNGTYIITSVDLGLEERPKAQLQLNKRIENIKVVLANQSVLFDVKQSGENVIWQRHQEYKLDKLGRLSNNKKYADYYKDNHRYAYRSKVNDIVKDEDKGLVQLTMDEEIMHGANIEITYELEVKNVGEIDYNSKEFYYLGVPSGDVVTTSVNQIVDYVANNLEFKSVSNDDWNVIQIGDLITGDENTLVNNALEDNVKKYNYVVTTQLTKVNRDLLPTIAEKSKEKNMSIEENNTSTTEPEETIEEVNAKKSTKINLILSKAISTENTSEDLTYDNISEIVKTSNTVGRRMAFSVVGNQNPAPLESDGTIKEIVASEVDASAAEKVLILPPYGHSYIMYIVIATMGIVLAGGITLIIRKVLRK